MTVVAKTVDYLRRPRTRRRVVVLSDQAVSSLSNVIPAILVARSFDSPEPFGAFGLAMIVFRLVLGGTKAVVGHPLLSLYSPLEPEDRRQAIPDLQGATICVSALASLVLVAVSVLLGGISGSALLALAVVLPLVLMQDAWRFTFVVDRPWATLAIDLVWLLAVLVTFSLAPVDATVAWYIVVWGLGGGLGAIVALAIGGRGLRGTPRPLHWILSHRETGFRFFGEYLTAQGVGHLVATSVGPIAGLGALGSVRASQVFYGPHNTLHQGIYMAVVPEGAQSQKDPVRLRRMLILVSSGLAALSALWMLVGLMLPTTWGEALFGGTWAGARDVLAPMGIATIAAGIGSGGFLGLRSLADAKRGLHARLRITPWQIVCPLMGVAIAGAWGFAAGLAIGRTAAAVIWWRAFNQSLQARDSLIEGSGPSP